MIPSQYKKLFIAKDTVKCLTSKERKIMIEEFDSVFDPDKEKIKELMRKYIEEYSG